MRNADLIMLWARAAGRCCFPDCKVVLWEAGELCGHAAHIIAHAERGPRGRALPTRFRVDCYDNLILLCAHHHMIVDTNSGAYPAEVLQTWKAEHESWVRSMTEPRETPVRWTVLVLEDAPRIDVAEAQAALGAGNAAGRVHRLGDLREVERLVARTPLEERRFAVFCLASIPLSVALGFALGDRGRVRLFHYDRDRGSWKWPADTGEDAGIELDWAGSGETATVRVSLSAAVPPQAAPEACVDAHVRAAQPSVRWLERAEQLPALGAAFGRVLEGIRERGCRRAHLYYAGPACGAVLLGRLYNPRMNPPLTVYEYAHARYRRALVLGE